MGKPPGGGGRGRAGRIANLRGEAPCAIRKYRQVEQPDYVRLGRGGGGGTALVRHLARWAGQGGDVCSGATVRPPMPRRGGAVYKLVRTRALRSGTTPTDHGRLALRRHPGPEGAGTKRSAASQGLWPETAWWVTHRNHQTGSATRGSGDGGVSRQRTARSGGSRWPKVDGGNWTLRPNPFFWARKKGDLNILGAGREGSESRRRQGHPGGPRLERLPPRA